MLQEEKEEVRSESNLAPILALFLVNRQALLPAGSLSLLTGICIKVSKLRAVVLLHGVSAQDIRVHTVLFVPVLHHEYVSSVR